MEGGGATGYSERLIALEQAAMDVTTGDIPARLAQLAKDELGSEFTRVLVERWAATDPAAAAAWVANLVPSPARLVLGRIVAVRWVAAAPDIAVDWMRRLPPGNERETLAQAMGGEIVNADPASALLLAEELPSPFSRELRERALAAWAKEEPFRAADFVVRFLPREDAERALTRVARSWAGVDTGDETAILVDFALDWERQYSAQNGGAAYQSASARVR